MTLEDHTTRGSPDLESETGTILLDGLYKHGNRSELLEKSLLKPCKSLIHILGSPQRPVCSYHPGKNEHIMEIRAHYPAIISRSSCKEPVRHTYIGNYPVEPGSLYPTPLPPSVFYSPGSPDPISSPFPSFPEGVLSFACDPLHRHKRLFHQFFDCSGTGDLISVGLGIGG